MTSKIRWFWARLNANYWFYPALFSVLGVALALVLISLDRAGLAEWLGDVRWIVPARPNSASNMLQVIAGSMIGVASTVFSITIAAVAYASGTYGPRLLTNFMEDRGNQLSLAVFIGTFVYALTVLRTVRTENESPSLASAATGSSALPGFVPQLSLLVAYLLMAVSVGVLVFFLNHVPSGIRINNVLEGIGRRLIEGIEETYPELADGREPRQRPGGAPIMAVRQGYVQLIDFAELAQIASERDWLMTLQVRTGDFVHAGVVLARVSRSDGGELTDELPGEDGEGHKESSVQAMRDCFTLGAGRTPTQDPQFLIDELVEIGLRALSPGVNDPFTAITALHWLGAATAEIGRRQLVKNLLRSWYENRDTEASEAQCPVIPLPDDFAHYMQRGFGAMRSAAATSPIATKVMFDVLHNVAMAVAEDGRRKLIYDEGRRLMMQVRKTLCGPDLTEVEQRFDSFGQAF